MPQVGLLIFLTCSIIFSLDAKQNYRFLATRLPVEVKCTVVRLSFLIFVDPYALSVDDRWGNRKLTGVNLLKNWGKLTLRQCRNWQHDSFDYASTDNLTRMEWAKSLVGVYMQAMITK